MALALSRATSAALDGRPDPVTISLPARSRIESPLYALARAVRLGAAGRTWMAPTSTPFTAPEVLRVGTAITTMRSSIRFATMPALT